MNLTQILRRHARAPAFTVVVLLLVAVAVAINATAFGALYAVRWKALPYADGDRLVELKVEMPKVGFQFALADRLREALLAERAPFAGALGSTAQAVSRYLADDGTPWQMARVTPDFSQVLGVAPALGRAFSAADAKDTASVALLSDTAWRGRFGADPAAVGRVLRVGNASYTIVGVMPPGFAFPDRRADAWIPLVWSAQERESNAQSFTGELTVVARLAPDATLAQAREKLGSVLRHDARLAPKLEEYDPQPRVTPLRERYVGTARTLELLQLAALILLAAVVASLVNLMFDRLLARARTQAIRRALGAGDFAIACDAAVDLALPLLGGLAAGLALVPFGLGLLQGLGLLPATLPQGGDFGVAAAGAGIAAALVALAASLATLPSRRSPQRSAQRQAGGLGRARRAMLVAQVMLATAMVGSVVLLARSAVNVLGVERGFDSRGVLMTSIDAFDVAGARQRGETPTTTGDAGFALAVEAMRADAAALPGVRHAAIAGMPPFSGMESSGTFGLPGFADKQQASEREVGPGYFGAMGIDFVAGEDFRADGEQAVAIVDERFVARYFGDADPLGARIDLTDERGELHPARIVGVVRSVKNKSLEEADALPMFYRPMTPRWSYLWLVTRTADADPSAAAAAVRERVLAHLPHARIAVLSPLDALVSDSLADRRHLLAAIGGFALTALALAALGLAAVLSFAVRRRRAELGVRMALGATPARVRNLVLRQGGTLIAAGLALGAALGLTLARLLADRLFGIGYADPASWAATLALVAAIALATCWLPARRAAATDPIEVLRNE